jgi:hypothetical protein
MPNPYVYSIALDFPGGEFDGAVSDRLNALIQANIPVPLLDISSDGENVTINFAQDLDGPQQQILDGGSGSPYGTHPAGGLIAQSTWFLECSLNGTVIPNGGEAGRFQGNEIDSAVIDVQLKDGNGNPISGSGDAVLFETDSLSPLNKSSANLDVNGHCQFAVGPTTLRGNVNVSVSSGSLPVVSFAVSFY